MLFASLKTLLADLCNNINLGTYLATNAEIFIYIGGISQLFLSLSNMYFGIFSVNELLSTWYKVTCDACQNVGHRSSKLSSLHGI